MSHHALNGQSLLIDMIGMNPMSQHMQEYSSYKGTVSGGYWNHKLLESTNIEVQRQQKGGRRPFAFQVSEKQYVKALEGLRKNDNGFIKQRAIDVKSHISNMSGRNKISALAGIGLKMGITHSMMDDDEDGVVSTLVTSGIYAGAVGGAALVGREMLKKVEMRSKKIPLWEKQVKQFEMQLKVEALKKQQHRNAVPKGDFKQEERIERLEQKEARRTKETPTDRLHRLKNSSSGELGNLLSHEERVVRTNKRIMKGGKIALGTIAVGGALSALHGIKHKMDVNDMKEAQEKNLERKQQERKNKQQDLSYNNPSFGNIVFDMFEERTAHYRMGDEKFK